MIPIWLIYLLIVVILLLDVLLVIGLFAGGIFLLALVVLGILSGFVEKMVDRFIRDILDRMEQYIKSHPSGKGGLASDIAGFVKMVYSILYTLYNAFQLASGLVIGLITLGLMFLDMAVLAVLNVGLLWLLNTYVI
jgi:hypothetical protein